MSNDTINVAFIGNPNCGKTTLFNAYTGAKLKVANWPGVTVEKKEGALSYHKHDYKLVDLPGIYSLTSYTMEEKLSRQYILDDEVDVIVDVVDASCLERNLYLALQLIELGKPVVIALNMMDIVQERGMEIDLHRLPEMLGVPTIPVSARKRTGLDILIHTVAHHKDKPHDKTEHQHDFSNKKDISYIERHERYTMVYSDYLEDKLHILKERVLKEYPNVKNPRWYAIKILEHDAETLKQLPNVKYKDVAPNSYEKEIINEKYNFIDEIIEETLVNKEEKAQMTDKVDALLTHRVWGIPMFLIIIAIIFFLTFTVGDMFAELLGNLIDAFSNVLTSWLYRINVDEFLISLISDGIIAGVGGILTFLPNIAVLFLCLAFLEDSGYMSRVAYNMDGLMNKMGLSGRAFIPLLLGFGCSVPAIMSSRTLENPRDRFRTIMVTPFISCSARLPVYVLFSKMFFPNSAMLVAYSMYLIGIVVAILIALIVSKLDHDKNVHSLLIELPEYKIPNARTVAIYVGDKVKDYLTKAGTTIFIASIILWFLMNLGTTGIVSEVSDSFISVIGKAILPIFKPIGINQWQLVVALIAGISAKEVVVSSCGVLFGISNISSHEGIVQLSNILTSNGFTSVNAYAFMVFVLLYVPCIATIGTIKSETKSVKKTIGCVCLQLAVAYFCSGLTYLIGNLIF